MACFLVPAAEAAITSVAAKKMKENEKNIGSYLELHIADWHRANCISTGIGAAEPA